MNKHTWHTIVGANPRVRPHPTIAIAVGADPRVCPRNDIAGHTYGNNTGQTHGSAPTTNDITRK